MPIDRIQLMNELKLGISRDMQRDLRPKRFAEKVRDKVRDYSPSPSNPHPLTKTGPYATGEFVESIKVRQTRRGKGLGGGRFLPSFEVYTLSKIGNLLEHGTGFDAPDTHSPWGRFTKTPEFAMFAKAAFFFSGTPDGE